jgi:hypothetical protein
MKFVFLSIFRLAVAASLMFAAVGLTSCKSSDPAYTAAMRSLYSKGVPKEKIGPVAVVDFTKSSTKKRLTIYEPDGKKVSSHLVAHGYGSGKKYAESFSNRSGSGQSSLGLYQIGSSYYGKHGKSLKLHGLESGLNSNAYSRAVVMHSANYVSSDAKWENFWAGEGWRIGRSAGCPAVSAEDMKYVLQKLPTGSFLYIYAGQEVPITGAPPAQHSMLASGANGGESGVAVEAKSGNRKRVEIKPR